MKKIWTCAKKHIKNNQRNQALQINKHKSSTSNYHINDQIWLIIRNIQIDKSSRKLNHKMLKLFKISKKRESLYKLDFSEEMNIYSMFHISFLRKNFENLLSRQIILSLSSVMIDDEQKF
jgi:hypothetical protein